MQHRWLTLALQPFVRGRVSLGSVAGEHVWNLVSTLVTRVLILILYAFVVRYFLNTAPAQHFATISLLLLMFSYVQLLDLGMGYAVTQRYGRAIAVGATDASNVLRTALPIYLICATATSVVLLAVASPLSWLLFDNGDQTRAIRILAIGVWPLFLSAFVASILQALNRLVLLNLSRLVVDIAKAAGFVYAATASNPVTMAVAITVAGGFLRLTFDLALMRRMLVSFRALVPRFSMDQVRENFSLGWPMIVALLLGIANTLLDRVFVSRVLGPSALADYTIAYDLSTKAFFLVGAVGTMLYTPILRRSATARSHGSLTSIAYASVAVVGVAYFLPLGILAEPILAWWINPDIAGSAATVTRIGALMGVCYLTMSVAFNTLQASGRASTIMNGTIIAFLVMVSAFVLMPRGWGAEGVMAIVALAFFSQFAFYLFAMRKL